MAAFTAIDDAGLFFNIKLYTGTGGATQAQTGVGFAPDVVWIKSRSDTESHVLGNTILGGNLYNYPNTTATAGSLTTYLKSFDADGFTVGTGGFVGSSGSTYVGWCWKAGTTSGITTDGNTTITPSAYSFNQDVGFSIIQYTGNDTANQKVPHGLGVAPHQIIIKQTDATRAWPVYNIGTNGGSSPEDYAFVLNDTSAKENDPGFWNDTAPDTVNFTVDRDGRTNGDSGGNYMAYCWAPKQGYSKFGFYTGNGNLDGPFVYTGFRPAFIIRKTDAGTDAWMICDRKRLGYNPNNAYLFSNATQSESDITRIDFLSNGFKLRTTDSGDNSAGSNYIYMAFAESPLVNSEGIPTNAR